MGWIMKNSVIDTDSLRKCHKNAHFWTIFTKMLLQISLGMNS